MYDIVSLATKMFKQMKRSSSSEENREDTAFSTFSYLTRVINVWRVQV